MNTALFAKSAKTLGLVAGGILASTNLAMAAAPAPSAPAPTMATATYAVVYTCTGGPGCSLGAAYAHNYSISIDRKGGLKGTGSEVGYPQITESLIGSLSAGRGARPVSLTYVSTYTNLYAGYWTKVSGTVDPKTGAMSGTATSGLPGNPGWDAQFSVTGTRTAYTLVHGVHGDKDDVNRVDPPSKPKDTDEATTEAPKHQQHED